MSPDDACRRSADRFIAHLRAANDAQLARLRAERDAMRPAEDAFRENFRVTNDAELERLRAERLW